MLDRVSARKKNDLNQHQVKKTVGMHIQCQKKMHELCVCVCVDLAVPLCSFSFTNLFMFLEYARPVERSEVDPAAPSLETR